MLTVADVLSLEVMQGAQVLAGKEGLNRRVRWVHIADVPDAADTVEGGELLLTAGYAIPAVPAEQAQFLNGLADMEIAGLVVAEGKYISTVPYAMLSAADERGLPLIAVPWETQFIDVTRAVHEHILSEQYALLRQSNDIHRKLTAIVLEGGGHQQLAYALTDLIKRSVIIKDADFRVLAHATYGPIDPVLQETVSDGRTPEKLLTHPEFKKTLRRIQKNLTPQKLSPIYEQGMTTEHIIAPVIVERRLYGYVWLISGDHPMQQLDTVAVEHAATVAALIMLRALAVRETEARLQADLITRLLSSPPVSKESAAELREQAAHFGLDLSTPHRVAVLRSPQGALPDENVEKHILPLVANSLTSRAQKASAKRYRVTSLLHRLGLDLVLIMPDTPDGMELVQEICRRMPRLRVGVGSSAPSPANLSSSYKHALETLQIAGKLEGGAVGAVGNRGVFSFDDLGFLHWLYHLPQDARSGNPYIRHVDALVTEDRTRRTQLVETLATFLDCGGNAAETARRLMIHRNTLSYRLKHVENITGLSLNEPAVRINLQVALKAALLLGDI